MKKFVAFILAFTFIGISKVIAQYNTPQNYNWAFGTRAGVSFSSGSPVVTSSNMDTNEGMASVSSPTGALLFYTDGTSVWNSTGAVMSGSAGGLTPWSTWSTTQAALIAPVLSNPNQYYVFSIEEVEDYLAGDMGASRLYYCIVDMTLSGGLGNVVPGTLGTLFANPVAEKMIIIPGNNCNLWLVTHARDLPTFRCYEITTTGISSTPVSSTLGTFTGFFSYDLGVIKCSPNRLRIVAQNWNDGNATGTYATTLNGTELYDFDPNTGIVSNCRVLESTNLQYGADFSPDNTKLYVEENIPVTGVTHISQYDVTLPTAAAIVASKYLVVSNPNETYTDMKLASNGKIYFATLTALPSSYLSVINTPNAAGAACGYANNVVNLSPVAYRYANEGLPNVFQNVVHDTTFQHHDTAVCFSSIGSITLTAPTGTSYYWYDGVTTATHSITAIGNYWVNITTGCNVISDTFHVTASTSGTTYQHSDTSVCMTPGGSITLTAPTGTAYSWYDATTAATHTVTTSGNYWVHTTSGCGIISDTFHVTITLLDTTFEHTDTAVCFATLGSITLTSPTGTAYHWYDGVTTATHNITTTGSYWVNVTNGCHHTLDTFIVTHSVSDTAYNHTDISQCALLPLTLTAPGGYTTYVWNDGAGGTTHGAPTSGTYWVRATDACFDLVVDTMHVTRITPDTSHAVRDTSVCATAGTVTLLSPAGYTTYQWNTGSSSTSIAVTTAGTYWVYCDSGCHTFTDSFHVTFITPAFASTDTNMISCFPNNLALVAPAGYPTYQWQDGSTGPSFVATAAGTYWVDAISTCADYLDTFYVAERSIGFTFGPDTTVCSEIKLSVPIHGPGVTYLWQDGGTDSVEYTTAYGPYYAAVSQGGCTASDTIIVSHFHLAQNIPDTFICKGVDFAINLHATLPPGGSIIWNDGSTNPDRIVTDSGTYWVYVRKDECLVLDTVHVVTGSCDCAYNMPSAFTPNKDGLNDYAFPWFDKDCALSGYQFNLYNRWGQLVFTSDVPGKGWDGNFYGVPQDLGVYMYYIQFFYGVQGKPVILTGDLTLIR